MSEDSLITRYRPKTWDEFIGNDAAVKSLMDSVDTRNAHQYLLTGASGCGKTTAARIMATEFGCKRPFELDAARSNSVDDTRAIIEELRYKPITEDDTKVFIIDECFDGNTLIDTPTGPKKISCIQEGDQVLNAAGVSKVRKVFKNKVALTRVVVVRLDTGLEIRCSAEHAFLTAHGWKKAIDLTGEYLVSSISSKMLKMWDRHSSNWAGCPALHRVSNQTMHSLRKRVHINEYVKTAHTLFPQMWGYNSEPQTAGTTIYRNEGGDYSGYTKIAYAEQGIMAHPLNRIIPTYDYEQSYGFSRSYRKNDKNERDERDTSYMECSDTRRQRDQKSSGRDNGPVIGGYSKLPDKNKLDSYPYTSLLQGGCWNSGIKSGDRNRWAKPFRTTQTEGWEKEGNTNGTRVVSVTHQKQASRSESRENSSNFKTPDQLYEEFFDLEIEGHPSYRVNGYIVHNCHMLSKAAWNSLLKSIEEPPKHVYWIFCTTDAGRVIPTIKTRCFTVDLKPLSVDSLIDLLEGICDREKYNPGKGIVDVCCEQASGSPRQAIANLAKCWNAENVDDALVLLRAAGQNSEAVDLARALVNGLDFIYLKNIISKLEGIDAESVRRIVLAYITKVVMEKETENGLEALIPIMAAFSQPFGDEGMAPVLLACLNIKFASYE